MKRAIETMAPYQWAAVLMSAAFGFPTVVFVLDLVLNGLRWSTAFGMLFGYMCVRFALRAAALRLEATGGTRRGR